MGWVERRIQLGFCHTGIGLWYTHYRREKLNETEIGVVEDENSTVLPLWAGRGQAIRLSTLPAS